MYRISRNRGQGEQFRLAQLSAGAFPLTHVSLTKDRGELVHVDWRVSNTGDLPGQAYTQITENGIVLGDSDEVTISPGAVDVIVQATWTISPSFPAGDHNIVANIYNWTQATNPGTLMATHNFNVTVLGQGPVLVVNNAPTQPDIY
jgi:hypothetical protein